MYESEIRINTKNKMKIESFENHLFLHTINVKKMLMEENVKFHHYFIFLIKEPKYRIIMSQTIEDKIINHLVARYFLLDYFEPTLLDCNVATRKNKGGSYGIKLTKKYINMIKKEKKDIYYLKCDISKFFYNIDHNILKKIIRMKIKDPKALLLIDKIIDTTNENYISKYINKICTEEIERIKNLTITEAEKIKKIKEIEKIPRFKQKEKGIPIGNMTSQAFAIIYLNTLDHYIKENLHMKYYIRYMDDFVILDTDKERLRQIKEIIEDKLEKEFALKLNPKTHIGKLSNGLDFLGFRFVLKHDKLYMKLRTSTKKIFKKKLRIYNKLYLENKVDYKKVESVLASYRGHIKTGDTYYLYRNNFYKFPRITEDFSHLS